MNDLLFGIAKCILYPYSLGWKYLKSAKNPIDKVYISLYGLLLIPPTAFMVWLMASIVHDTYIKFKVISSHERVLTTLLHNKKLDRTEEVYLESATEKIRSNTHIPYSDHDYYIDTGWAHVKRNGDDFKYLDYDKIRFLDDKEIIGVKIKGQSWINSLGETTIIGFISVLPFLILIGLFNWIRWVSKKEHQDNQNENEKQTFKNVG